MREGGRGSGWREREGEKDRERSREGGSQRVGDGEMER